MVAGSFPLSLQGFVLMWQDLSSSNQRESGKKDQKLKNTKSPAEVHWLENCAIEMGDAFFFFLFKPYLKPVNGLSAA